MLIIFVNGVVLQVPLLWMTIPFRTTSHIQSHTLMNHRKPVVKMRVWRIWPIVILVGTDILPIGLPFEQTAFLIKGGGNVVCWLLPLLTFAALFIVLCIRPLAHLPTKQFDKHKSDSSAPKNMNRCWWTCGICQGGPDSWLAILQLTRNQGTSTMPWHINLSDWHLEVQLSQHIHEPVVVSSSSWSSTCNSNCHFAHFLSFLQ